MGSIGGPELLIVLIVALVVLGPERLPAAARQVGRVIGDLRRISSGFQAEVRDALAEAERAGPAGPAVPPGPSSDPSAGSPADHDQPGEPPAREPTEE